MDSNGLTVKEENLTNKRKNATTTTNQNEEQGDSNNTKIMKVKCKFVRMAWTLIDPNTAYTCSVTSCDITTSGVEPTFDGRHKGSLKNRAVTALQSCNTKIHYFPRNLTKTFPNLVFLQFRNCGLKEVSAKDLAGVQQLEDLSLEDNILSSLPIDLFSQMPKLREVRLSGNKIEEFDVKILEPIKNTIECFDILNNPGISAIFEKTSISFEEFVGQLKQSKMNEQMAKKFQALTKRLETLFDTGKHSDFTIQVKDRKFDVHKGILASESLVLDKMFSGNPEEVANAFNCYRPEVVEEFLRFIYVKSDPSEENVIELFSLAVEFDVADLKLLCESLVSRNINPENARQIFNFANLHSFENTKRAAFEVIQQCHPEIGNYLYHNPGLLNVNLDEIIRQQFQGPQPPKKTKVDDKEE